MLSFLFADFHPLLRFEINATSDGHSTNIRIPGFEIGFSIGRNSNIFTLDKPSSVLLGSVESLRISLENLDYFDKS